MNSEKNELTRREALGFAACLCVGGHQYPEDHNQKSRSADGLQPKKTHLASQLRLLQMELYLFNQEIVPRFVDGRSNAPTYRIKRAAQFLALSLYFRRELDIRSAGASVELDSNALRERLRQLYVSTNIKCFRYDSGLVQYPGMQFLQGHNGQPTHAYFSLAQGATLARLTEDAEEICEKLRSSAQGVCAFETICSAPLDKLENAFTRMRRDTYLRLVETLFMIRPETPAKFLTLQTANGPGFTAMLSDICGSTMERLANNYFHQTLAIGRLSECNGTWHGFIAGQVFDILVQKWLSLMGVEHSGDMTRTERSGKLTLAMARGVVEEM